MTNTFIELTEKEEKVLRAICAESNFNCVKIDPHKTWAEQNLGNDFFEAFADVRDYGCGMQKEAVRGIFGSLVKKGLIYIDEDGYGNDALYIREKHFDNIKKTVLAK